MRANVNVARKQRHTLTLENFKGVDLSSSPLRVSTQRATYMRNMINENGANHKRPGWRELFSLEGKINGIFPFTESGEGPICEVLLVHAGTALYRAVRVGESFETTLLFEGLPDAAVQCFYRDGRAYLIGGGAYVVYGAFDGAFAAKNAAEIAYVPTTTINKTAGEQGYGAMLDEVNLLTPWRKNTVIVPTSDYTYIQLDAEPDPNSDITVTVGINRYGYFMEGSDKIEHYFTGSISYKGRPFEGEWDSEDTAKHLSVYKVDLIHKYNDFTRVYDADSGYVHYEESWYEERVESLSDVTVHIKWHAIGGDDPSTWVEYYDPVKNAFSEIIIDKFPAVAVDMQGRVYLSGVFYREFDETGEDFDEMETTAEVTFRVAEDQGDKIKNCTVAATFGVDGESNRLFLAGNPAEKGLDRWSEADDYTYFPDGNAMFVGGGEAAVTGYARLSDNTLAIFKEEVPGVPTIYYRPGAKTTMTAADGATVYREYFPVAAGVIGIGLLAPRASANLDGDPLFLSRTGVYGVELSQNVSSGERYARERSRAIREVLCKKDLAGAVATVHRGKYYLALGDGTVFVADGRYHASFEGTPDVGYEWWVWDNVPAVCFSQVGGALCFGTADGRVCAFREELQGNSEQGRFFDTSFTAVKAGELLGDTEGNRLTYGNITVYEGDVLTLDGVGEFTVTALDKAAQSFALADGNGDIAAVPAGLLTGKLRHDAVVVAEFEGPVMDLGTSTARKILCSLGVVLEPGVATPVEILLKTRDSEQVTRVQNERGLDLSALDLADVSFTGSFAAGHVRRMNLRNFNFIQIKMRSSLPQDMAVAGVTLEYKINQNQRGYY